MGVLIPMAGTMTSFGGMKAAVSTPFNCTMLNDSQVQIVSTVRSNKVTGQGFSLPNFIDEIRTGLYFSNMGLRHDSGQ